MKYEALKAKYEAEIAIAKAELMEYFDNSVGVGDHPNIIDSMDMVLGKLSQAEEKLDSLIYFIGYQKENND
tara:strand:+ start:272 stop:484 length:213 start_codon:yes stop_codon:yes gene_type:complete